MNALRQIIKGKPKEFFFISFIYLVIVSLMKWGIHPTLDTAWFVFGGLVGVYFLDIAESFFALSPSPFRSIVFMSVYIAVSFFVTTSSSVDLARGLVLSLFLQLLLWQVGEWRLTGSTNSWYTMVSSIVPARTQQWILVGFVALFFVETYLFIR